MFFSVYKLYWLWCTCFPVSLYILQHRLLYSVRESWHAPLFFNPEQLSHLLLLYSQDNLHIAADMIPKYSQLYYFATAIPSVNGEWSVARLPVLSLNLECCITGFAQIFAKLEQIVNIRSHEKQRTLFLDFPLPVLWIFEDNIIIFMLLWSMCSCSLCEKCILGHIYMSIYSIQVILAVSDVHVFL